MKIFKKIFFIVLVLSFLQGCGYQPLLSSKNQKFNIVNVNIYGDKKLARTLGNYFTEIENADNNLILEITADKKKLVSNKTSIGASSEYTVTINFNIKVISEADNKVIFTQNFNNTSSFKTSKVHFGIEKSIITFALLNVSRLF